MTDEYINSEVCQKCAKCCKVWWIYTDSKDDVVRASWLDTDKVFVTKVKEGLWKIIFDFPCKQLEEKDGKYYCKKHGAVRPEYCKTYPANFKKEEDEEVIEVESRMCPIIKKVTR